MDHLTSERIQELRAGGLGAEARQHIRECELCQSRLFEERLLDMLLTQVHTEEKRAVSSPHPSLEERLLFIAGDLDATTAAALESHFSECETCTILLMKLQTPPENVQLLEPPSALAERVKTQFLSTPVPKSLGQLFLETLDRVTVRLTFRPAQGLSGLAPPLPHGLLAAQPSHTSPKGKPQASSPLELTVGMVRLTLTGIQTAGQIALTITARNTTTGEAQSDLSISLLPATGEAQATATDAQGQVTLILRSEQSRLLFGTTPASEIELRMVQEP